MLSDPTSASGRERSRVLMSHTSLPLNYGDGLTARSGGVLQCVAIEVSNHTTHHRPFEPRFCNKLTTPNSSSYIPASTIVSNTVDPYTLVLRTLTCSAYRKQIPPDAAAACIDGSLPANRYQRVLFCDCRVFDCILYGIID